jgi:hypothetical protein
MNSKRIICSILALAALAAILCSAPAHAEYGDLDMGNPPPRWEFHWLRWKLFDDPSTWRSADTRARARRAGGRAVQDSAQDSRVVKWLRDAATRMRGR